jgi:putative inorganic carbon (HCO3(-)) transporter
MPLTLFNPKGDLITAQPFAAGIQVDSVDVTLLLLYAHWIASAAFNGRRNKLVVGGSMGLLLLTWILLLLVQSALNATDFRYSVFEIVVLFKGFLLFWYLINNINTIKDLRIVVYSLFAGAIAQSCYMWFQYITKLNYTAHADLVTYIGPEGFRSVGFTGSPDNASAMISLVFPVGLAVYLLMRKRAEKFIALVCIAVVIVALGFTLVRAAWFAVMISSAILLVLLYSSGGMSTRKFGKAVFVVIAILIVTSPLIVHRFEHGTKGEDRWPLMQTSLNMFKDNLLLGVGANNYAFNIDEYTPVQSRHEWAYTVHNEYMLRLAESGIPGTVLYYAFTLIMMVKLWKLRRSREVWIYVIAIGFFSALVGSLFHRTLSMFFYQSLYLMICVMMAVTYAAEKLDRSQQAQRLRTWESESNDTVQGL